MGGGSTQYTGLGAILSEGTIAFGIANTIEVFYIWNLILIWLGLQITAGLSKGSDYTHYYFIDHESNIFNRNYDVNYKFLTWCTYVIKGDKNECHKEGDILCFHWQLVLYY